MTLPQTVLTKRPRGVGAFEKTDEEGRDSHRPRPNKKGKINGITTTGALDEAGSTKTKRVSKAVRRGAERLVIQNARGVSDRPLQDPSVRQVSTGIIAQEQQPWIAGSVEGETWYPVDITVPQKKTVYYAEGSKPEETQNALFQIPRKPDQRHKALLEATDDDWARGTIHLLKCRLCPAAGFTNWGLFMRHCDTMEAHPASISFCEHCGDFFARRDSLKRHYKSRPIVP